MYVDDAARKAIGYQHTVFASEQLRLEKLEQNLEEKVLAIAEKRFRGDRRQPDAYSLTEISGFYILEFLYVTGSYISLDEIRKAAK